MKKLCKSVKQAKNFNAESILRHVMHEVLGLDSLQMKPDNNFLTDHLIECYIIAFLLEKLEN